MWNKAVSKSDKDAGQSPRFSPVERLVLASGACVLSVWIGGLAWVSYKLVSLII